MCGADAARLARAFHPHAAITGHMQGAPVRLTVTEFAAVCAANGPEAGPPVWRIAGHLAAGDIAAVAVEDVYQGLRFTDLLTLMRTPEGWRITHKAFTVHGPA
jgi:hypothetical protein